MSVEPFAWKNRASLIESVLPAQKISAEAQKERKAGAGQTLTALGSYWKGRKPLILVKACLLGALLPASSDPAADLAIFEKLMSIDDEAFLRREMTPSCVGLVKRLHSMGWMKEAEAHRLFVIHRRNLIDLKGIWEIKPFEITEIDALVNSRQAYVGWSEGITAAERHTWELRWVQSFDYLERVGMAKRPEELEQGPLFEPVWAEVNSYLGTDACSIPELVEQLGIMRFGHRPKVGDTFCGGGSIPYEAARLGCDAFASDLNPIACMLTWGAINIIGADPSRSKQIEATQRAIAAAVDREICALGIEHDREGNRAKTFLYCLETRCPQTGWMVPITGSWIISKTRSVIARMIPDHATKTFRIEIAKGGDEIELAKAAKGTTEDGDLVYELDGETYRTRLKTIRGDYRLPNKTTGNMLRRWEKHDFAPQPDDIYQERLYCIQWITKETLDKGRPETFFAAVTDADLERERRVAEIVRQNLAQWQDEGLVPDMVIEPGDKTDEPIRTRGWTHWHHLFNARQLVSLSTFRRLARQDAQGQIGIAKIADYGSRLCRWDAGHKGSSPQAVGTFTNQALNTLANYGTKASGHLGVVFSEAVSSHSPIHGATTIETQPASSLQIDSDIFVTDPPYADAVNYHEITEYFIAWFRKNPPPPFSDWVGIVSTGLIFHNAPEAKALLERRFGTLILDEAHRARRAQGISSKTDEPNNLLKFMREAARHARHVILGTATPIQTEVGELWDLLGILNNGANHVLGRDFSRWKQPADVLPILNGEKDIRDEVEAWNLIRNPLPPRSEGHLFDHVRSDLQLRKDQHYTDRPLTDLDEFTRSELQEEITQRRDSLTFFQRNNPILRHTVLRKRATLEELGLLDKIAVDIWPSDNEMLSIFDGFALRTSAEFDAAYEAANAFAAALAKRTQAAGFMKTMMQSRICSSIASGLATAEKLLKKKIQLDEEDEEAALLFERVPDIIDEERFYLDRIVHFLKQRPTDPKLDAVVHFLTVRGWLELGCIVFSQYYDTANWVAKSLTELLPEERVALYAGAGKSGLFFGGEWRSVERDDIKKAVRDRTIRLVVATDAACEGLNLQTLGTLINVDLPWNPSRLEQRIGRIKRIGQTRDRVDMLNLVYHDTNDEKVYGVLSQRMKDRYDLFGSLPDTIEDDWIEDVENLEEHLRQFTERKKRANAFELRYASSVQPEGPGWEQCERVLARRDIVGRLSEGW